jgi:hypothetical protein
MFWKIGKFSMADAQAVCHGIPEPEDFSIPLEKLMYIQKHLNWWLGDIALMAEDNYGDDCYQYFPDGFSVDHIDRCMAMAKGIKRDQRNPMVSWSMHREVIGLAPAIQECCLKKAENEGWNQVDLRSYVQANFNRVTTH